MQTVDHWRIEYKVFVFYSFLSALFDIDNVLYNWRMTQYCFIEIVNFKNSYSIRHHLFYLFYGYWNIHLENVPAIQWVLNHLRDIKAIFITTLYYNYKWFPINRQRLCWQRVMTLWIVSSTKLCSFIDFQYR